MYEDRDVFFAAFNLVISSLPNLIDNRLFHKMRWTSICIAWLLFGGVANSNPSKDDGTRFLVTKRSDNTKFLTSIARLNACEIPGPPALFIIPWNLYPAESRRHNEQGTAILQLLFDSNGCVRKATIVQSTGFYRLDNVSLEFLMTLKLQIDKFHITQTDDGQPTTRMPIVWTLTKPYDPKDPCTQGAKCVDDAPPPPQPEMPGTAPEPGYVWMPGYYFYYAKTAYQWNDGHWEPGRPGFHWNAPQWSHVGSKWVFVSGDWEADK